MQKQLDELEAREVPLLPVEDQGDYGTGEAGNGMNKTSLPNQKDYCHWNPKYEGVACPTGSSTLPTNKISWRAKLDLDGLSGPIRY